MIAQVVRRSGSAPGWLRPARTGSSPQVEARWAGTASGVLLLAAAASWALWAIRVTGGGDHRAWSQVYVQPAVVALAAVVCLLRGVSVRAERRAWIVLAVGMVCAAFAEGEFNYRLVHRLAVPFPSWRDAVWLVSYPCALYALGRLARVRIRRPRLTFGLDGLVVGCAAAAFVSKSVVARWLSAPGRHGLAAVVAVAYPVTPLILLTVTLAVPALAAWRLTRPWTLLVPGLVLVAGAQVAVTVAGLRGAYQPGEWPQQIWMSGLVLVAFAAGSPRPPARREPESRAVLWLPMAALLAAAALLTLERNPLREPTTLIPAAAAVVLALGRMWLTMRDLRRAGDRVRLAYTDDLTGLANRRGFYAWTVKRVGGPGRRALLIMDLDRFKEVNDTLGHLAGDQLLAGIGPRLRYCVGPHDLVARIGGDEFAVLLADADLDRALDVAERLRAAVSAGIEVDGVALDVDAAVGIALLPEHGTDVHTLLRRADVAMYQAKAARIGVAVYEPGRDPNGRERLQTMAELRGAVCGGQLVVHYQPKVELDGGAVRGVEALVRWSHPQRGLVPPDDFLPMVEQAGLMPALTTEVLRTALRQVAVWHAAGVDLSVAVNLSPTSLVDADLPGRVARLLTEHGLPACALELEITEQFLMEDRLRARSVLERLRAQGIRVGVDDYGTGYSSLAYLRELPVDELKLDRSFVTPMVADRGAAAIVRSTIELAHSLGLSIVAEGVETAAAWDALARYGCDLAQGYYVSRPLPGDELLEWVRLRAGVPAARRSAGRSAPASAGRAGRR